MRPAGSQRNIGIPLQQDSQYYSRVTSLAGVGKLPVAYGIYRQD
jgi:hypothetical protein